MNTLSKRIFNLVLGGIMVAMATVPVSYTHLFRH